MSNYDQFSARVVYAGLRRMTDNRTVIKNAFSHWETQLSNQEFDVVTVVTSLVEYLDLTSHEKKTLMISLHAASNRLIDELPPVPGIVTGGSDIAGDPPSGNDLDDRTKKIPTEVQAPHLLVIQRYMQLFAQHMRKTSSGDFTEFRQEVASNGLSGIEDPLNTLISNWAADGMATLKLLNSVTEDDCKALAHHMYMLASEFIGPNKADNIVLKAIDGCLDLDAATRFDPRDLVN